MALLNDLLAEIEAFILARKMNATAFGLEAANDRMLVVRLRKGRGLTVATMERIRVYLDANKRRKKAPASSSSPQKAA